MARSKVAPKAQADKQTTTPLDGFEQELRTEVVVVLNRLADRPEELGRVSEGIRLTLDDLTGDASAKELMNAATLVRAHAARAHAIAGDIGSLVGILEGLALAKEAKLAVDRSD